MEHDEVVAMVSNPEPRTPNPGSSYSGWCDHCRRLHQLGRDQRAVGAVRALAREVARDRRFDDEGKMLGVLVAESSVGETIVLRAFSGMLAGEPSVEGFVGPTRSGRLTARSERETLSALDALSRRIAALDLDSAKHDVREAEALFEQELSELEAVRRRNKALRKQERALLSAADDAERLAELDAASRLEGREIRTLRRRRGEAIDPHRRRLDQLLEQRQALRRERKFLSRQLQAAMHDSHGLVNFAGRYASLQDLFGERGIPSGVGECCAPKLLHEAALRGLRPRAMAEVWCGPPPPDGARIDGELYGACDEKCGPLLGHLLCGADDPKPWLSVLFEDDHLVVVDKPAGLLSVPGRTSATRDCVESRLSLMRPRQEYLRAAHRLDEPTSGILVMALSAESRGGLTRAFMRGRIAKRYQAVVSGDVDSERGTIDLPLCASRSSYPRQVVDHRWGRRSVTEFVVRQRDRRGTRIDLFPKTGRTHQLRVHCAAPEGLGSPIVGDALYGDDSSAGRLMLHASRLELDHPITGRRLVIESEVPF